MLIHCINPAAQSHTIAAPESNEDLVADSTAMIKAKMPKTELLQDNKAEKANGKVSVNKDYQIESKENIEGVEASEMNTNLAVRMANEVLESSGNTSSYDSSHHNEFGVEGYEGAENCIVDISANDHESNFDGACLGACSDCDHTICRDELDDEIYECDYRLLHSDFTISSSFEFSNGAILNSTYGPQNPIEGKAQPKLEPSGNLILEESNCTNDCQNIRDSDGNGLNHLESFWSVSPNNSIIEHNNQTFMISDNNNFDSTNTKLSILGSDAITNGGKAENGVHSENGVPSSFRQRSMSYPESMKDWKSKPFIETKPIANSLGSKFCKDPFNFTENPDLDIFFTNEGSDVQRDINTSGNYFSDNFTLISEKNHEVEPSKASSNSDSNVNDSSSIDSSLSLDQSLNNDNFEEIQVNASSKLGIGRMESHSSSTTTINELKTKICPSTLEDLLSSISSPTVLQAKFSNEK